MNKEMTQEVLGSLALGVGIVVLALVATSARKLGYIDADTVTRLVMGANGLMIAWFGNRLPKAFVPSACARQASAGCRMVPGAERARLCGTVGVRPDSVGCRRRVRRGPGRHCGDGRLLPFTAGQSENRLIGYRRVSSARSNVCRRKTPCQ